MKNTSWLSPFKAINHMERIWAYGAGHATYPVHVEVHPTTRCNHRCKRCAAVIPKIPGKERLKLAYKRNTDIPLPRLLQIIEEFAGCGVKAVTLCGGGEPLVYQGIAKVISQVLNLGMALGLITNLNVDLEPHLLEVLGKAVFIRVSLDAADGDTYRLLHRPQDGGSFERVLGNIRELVQAGPDIGLNYLVQMENYRDIEKAAALAAELGVTYIRFTPAHTMLEGREYLPIWDEINSQFEKAKKHQSEGLVVLGAVERFRNMVENRKDYRCCVYHEFHPILGADLNLYPCCVLNYFKGYEMANLVETPFPEAWDHPERRRFSQSLDPSLCPPCWFDVQNRLMNYMVLEDKKHADFL